jgi:hypothetical protein
MEQKEFLVSLCTRYKGQKNNPNYKDKIWEYERFWVEMSMKKNPDFSALLDAYIDAGLRTFNMYDDAPITLKAVLYNRFMQQAEGMASTGDFKRWYDTYYRKK